MDFTSQEADYYLQISPQKPVEDVHARRSAKMEETVPIWREAQDTEQAATPGDQTLTGNFGGK